VTIERIAIGSRGSALAMAQARLVQAALEREGRTTRIVVIETEGDRRAPDTAWGEGAFVSAIERALIDGRVDVAVHSAKDVPTDEDPRLRIAAYLPRADPRDALVVSGSLAPVRALADLPAGSRVGTDSPRRAGFLRARRPDLEVRPLHGNVDTRLRRLDAGEADGLVLACAGLDRMQLGDRIAERLEPDLLPPAPGQGAIAMQIRGSDARMLALTAAIDDRRTRQAVEAERAFLRACGGGCRSPIGALGTIAGDELELLGGWASPDGSRTAVARRRAPVGAGPELARELADELATGSHVRSRTIGGHEEARRPASARVLVTRAAEHAGDLMNALRDAGFRPILVPAIAVDIDPSPGPLDEAAERLATYRWVVVTSANGARAIIGAVHRAVTDPVGPAWAAVGPATSEVLEREGIAVAFRPDRSRAAALGATLPIDRDDRVLVVRGDLADPGLGEALRDRGAVVDDVVAYRTREAPDESRGLLGAAIADAPIAAVLFTSGSTVRGLLALADAESVDVRSLPAVCIGEATEQAARDAGFRILASSTLPTAGAMAAATAAALSTAIGAGSAAGAPEPQPLEAS
jgi:hydroxymethylbilane synthase